MQPLRLVTYNIHKGLSALNRHLTLDLLAAALAEVQADVLCLQEVQGEHRQRAQRFHNWPLQAQADRIAATLQLHAHYGAHACYDFGHHGNAILARWPWQHCAVETLTLHALEQRGLVHGLCQPLGWPHPVHILSCHLNLLNRHRQLQLQRVMHYIAHQVPAECPLIVAGDFNDWREQAGPVLHAGGLVDAHIAVTGKPALSFPARMPFLPLDRVYVRGVTLRQARVLRGAPWLSLSDHLPLLIDCVPA